MTQKMSPAEIARKALEILDRDGWCKYTTIWTTLHARMYAGSDYQIGSHCLGGAWNEASGWGLTLEHLRESYEPLAAVIREQYPAYHADAACPWNVIPMMNDDGPTTEADVRSILEKVIADGS